MAEVGDRMVMSYVMMAAAAGCCAKVALSSDRRAFRAEMVKGRAVVSKA